MRVVFMGTPNFAAASLQRLYDDGFDVVGVFTQPDKQQNRGMKHQMSPVKSLALAHATPVFQPVTLKDAEVLRQLCALMPDVIAVVAYGKLLPPEILSLPPYGCINIHGSLLPKYRGAAPIQRAVLDGETTTGVTSMYMAPQMDAGDMIFTEETPIGDTETAGDLFERLAVIGAALLSKTLWALADKTAPRIKQDERFVTVAPPLSKDMTPIDWGKSTREILCHIRGLIPWPVATADIGGTVFKVFRAEAVQTDKSAAPGTFLSADANGLVVTCRDGAVRLLEVQAPGGKRMAAGDYLRGHPLCQ
ncbi:methionyl-tRNA formyltransferase [Oscillospiraceae bacterium CM]|nr:methionyl-tRNA formyltransferase [Oscillospiraceae bacterium CM]